MKNRKHDSHDMMDDDEMNKLRDKYNKKETFHKRKSRTVDFALSAHRKDFKEIMRFENERDKSSSDDDDDDLIEEEQQDKLRSHRKLMLPPISKPQSPENIPLDCILKILVKMMIIWVIIII